MHKQRMAIASGAVAGMLGSFLPWAHLPFIGGAKSGTDFPQGWINLIFFTVILLLTQGGDRRHILDGGRRKAAVAFAALATLLGVLNLSSISSYGYGIGIGLYLVGAAGFAICVLAFYLE